MSGVVTVADISVVDSDTNDTQQQRASNNTTSTAQAASNPALIVGYVNQPGTGPEGANKTAGDLWDGYRVDLAAGQVVELNFGDASVSDLDLFIIDAAGNTVGEAIGVTRSECIRVTQAGNYIVAVNAYEGASAYELSWGPPRPGSTCANVTASPAQLQQTGSSFVTGQMIAKPVADAVGVAKGAISNHAKAMSLLDQAGLRLMSAPVSGAPMLLEIPQEEEARLKSNAALARVSMPKGESLMKSARRDALEGMNEQGRRVYETLIATKQLKASGSFAYVEVNRYQQPMQTAYQPWPPNDEYLSRQPHYGLIDLPEAFNALASLSPRPTFTPIVAVIDTGIVADHPDLQRMLVPGYDFVSDATRSGDGNGLDTNPNDELTSGGAMHGTHVAGTIAAEAFNNSGVIGVAPMARVMPLRVLGTGGGTTWDITQAMRYAAGLSNDSGTLPARRADVANLSLGGDGACSSLYADTISAARAQGLLIAVAAGNDGGPVGTPANCPGVFAVSAVSYDLRRASYSSFGSQVVVTAPGGDASRSSPAGQDLIFSSFASFVSDGAGGTLRRPGYKGSQGTSMATPHVAGVLALMRAVNPGITPAQVDSLLASGALTTDLGAAGRDTSFGYGLINANKAVTAAGSGSSTPGPDLPTLAVSTDVLDFGASLTELPITLRRINGSTDSPATYASSALDPAAITVLEPAAGNPAAGPYEFRVLVDRARLKPGENVIRVEITSAQSQRFPFDVSVAARTPAPVANLGVGPVYVLAVNTDDLSVAGQASVTTVGQSYNYTIGQVTATHVVIAAGTDTDNDGFICSASEPCGLYPVFSGSPIILDMSGGAKTGINFGLLSGSASAASLDGSASFALPSRGFARRLP